MRVTEPGSTTQPLLLSLSLSPSSVMPAHNSSKTPNGDIPRGEVDSKIGAWLEGAAQIKNGIYDHPFNDNPTPSEWLTSWLLPTKLASVRPKEEQVTFMNDMSSYPRMMIPTALVLLMIPWVMLFYAGRSPSPRKYGMTAIPQGERKMTFPVERNGPTETHVMIVNMSLHIRTRCK
ncbi:hypothetical protein BKA64DRAFT_422557 [Cadophora sp. MPI-SDFR-AT-0126]|nr:hypothetical protein BKA64DRAFT_422557 [Leotiomycetes sp. MPI-SDFR-AT-0126]